MNLLAFGKAAAVALASSYIPIRKYIYLKKNEVFLFIVIQYKEKKINIKKTYINAIYKYYKIILLLLYLLQ